MPLSPHADEPGDLPAGALRGIDSHASGRLLSRFALLVAVDIASRGLRFLADILLGRHFGPVVFGQLNIAQSLAVQGMGIAACGLDTAGMREVAVAPARASTIATTVVVLRLFFGLATWGALAAVTWLVPEYRDSFELAAIYGLSMFTGALTLGWVAQAQGHVRAVGTSMLATHLVYFAGIQLAVALSWPPVAAPLALVVAEALCAAGLWMWIVRTMGSVTRPLPLAETWQFLHASLPIGGANILRGVITGSDVLLLGLFFSKADVGMYGGAFKLFSLGLSLGTMYFSLLLPHLAARSAQSLQAVNDAMYVALRRTLLAGAPILVAALILAGPVLRLLFGAGFVAATGALQILLLALPLNVVAGHFRSVLVATGRQRRDLALVAIGTIVHLAAKLILIPRLGITGAAWGTLVGEAALMLLSWRIAARP